MTLYTKVEGITPSGEMIPLISESDRVYAAFENEHLRDYVWYGLSNDLPVEGDKGWRTCWRNWNSMEYVFPGIQLDQKAREKLDKFSFLTDTSHADGAPSSLTEESKC